MIALLTLFVLVPVMSCIRAAALQLGWRWFLVPLFPTLPALGFVDALGLSLVVTLLVFNFTGADADEEAAKHKTAGQKLAVAATRGIFFYGFYFLSAIIVHALQGSA